MMNIQSDGYPVEKNTKVTTITTGVTVIKYDDDIVILVQEIFQLKRALKPSIEKCKSMDISQCTRK